MKIKILESAKKDLKEGFYFYESQERDVGSYFLESLFSDIESLRLFAGIHSTHFGKYHRLLSKRFPFAVYYRIEEDEVRIYAVLDCRRDPAWIRKRLQ
ncbi:type II toxin-antitoxin system RelE/ParE family toxin [Dehalococcoides sp.]|jgi:plasmid stabilization system protein ParE|uniref:type II toxin-antitoxin system RelE/ParE family toxin n=1 Tax=Dehalococcoides sp. TaxID=1966486 RepID=UPI0035626492